MLFDWVSSKFDPDWLKTLHLGWSDFTLVPGVHNKFKEQVAQLPLFIQLNVLLPKLEKPATLLQVIHWFSDAEESLHRALHFLLLNRIFKLRPPANNSVNLDSFEERVRLMLKNTEEKNHFDVLGVSQTAGDKDVAAAYKELAKTFHPDKVPPTASADLVSMVQELFSRFSKANEAISDFESRQAYKKELQFGTAFEILSLESEFDDAIGKLRIGAYDEALRIFDRLSDYKNYSKGEYNIYYMWALIKSDEGNRYKKLDTDQLTLILNEIPPEDRHNEVYFYIKGLYMKVMGDKRKAVDLFRKAVDIEKGFIPAKRELLTLKASTRSSSKRPKKTSSGLFDLWKKKGS